MKRDLEIRKETSKYEQGPPNIKETSKYEKRPRNVKSNLEMWKETSKDEKRLGNMKRDLDIWKERDTAVGLKCQKNPIYKKQGFQIVTRKRQVWQETSNSKKRPRNRKRELEIWKETWKYKKET